MSLKGRPFETWDEIAQAVEATTAYWNAHWHPFVWAVADATGPSAR